MSWQRVYPVVDLAVRLLCQRPYPNHPKGCPNWGKRDSCPPKAPRLTETLNLEQPVYAVWNAFNFDRHVQRMRDRHPEWSLRQCECCLYWQGTARKALYAEVRKFLYTERQGRPWRVIACPEAQGVNVTETMKQVGIVLEWPPKTVAYQVALCGFPVEGHS